MGKLLWIMCEGIEIEQMNKKGDEIYLRNNMQGQNCPQGAKWKLRSNFAVKSFWRILSSWILLSLTEKKMMRPHRKMSKCSRSRSSYDLAPVAILSLNTFIECAKFLRKTNPYINRMQEVLAQVWVLRTRLRNEEKGLINFEKIQDQRTMDLSTGGRFDRISYPFDR